MLDSGLKLNIVVSSLLCAVASGVFVLTSTPLVNLVWVFFLSFTISTATPHTLKEVPNLFFSQIAGWGWAMLMYYICVYVMQLSGSLALGFFLAIFIGSVVMFTVHFKWLMNTWFNNLSMVFAAICSFFATQDFSIIVYIIIALTIGSILAAVVDPICQWILKAHPENVSTK